MHESALANTAVMGRPASQGQSPDKSPSSSRRRMSGKEALAFVLKKYGSAPGFNEKRTREYLNLVHGDDSVLAPSYLPDPSFEVDAKMREEKINEIRATIARMDAEELKNAPDLTEFAELIDEGGAKEEEGENEELQKKAS